MKKILVIAVLITVVALGIILIFQNEGLIPQLYIDKIFLGKQQIPAGLKECNVKLIKVFGEDYKTSTMYIETPSKTSEMSRDFLSDLMSGVIEVKDINQFKLEGNLIFFYNEYGRLAAWEEDRGVTMLGFCEEVDGSISWASDTDLVLVGSLNEVNIYTGKVFTSDEELNKLYFDYVQNCEIDSCPEFSIGGKWLMDSIAFSDDDFLFYDGSSFTNAINLGQIYNVELIFTDQWQNIERVIIIQKDGERYYYFPQ
jgi:hypothetical protein